MAADSPQKTPGQRLARKAAFSMILLNEDSRRELLARFEFGRAFKNACLSDFHVYFSYASAGKVQALLYIKLPQEFSKKGSQGPSGTLATLTGRQWPKHLMVILVDSCRF